VDWIDLAQDRDKGCAVLKVAEVWGIITVREIFE
jgi:hypothetical protein